MLLYKDNERYCESTLELVANSLLEIEMSEEDIDKWFNKIRSSEIEIDLSKSIRTIRSELLDSVFKDIFGIK